MSSGIARIIDNEIAGFDQLTRLLAGLSAQGRVVSREVTVNDSPLKREACPWRCRASRRKRRKKVHDIRDVEQTLFVRPVDIGPAGNIHRRDVIGATSEVARYTGERILRTTIGFIDTTTDRTSPGCVTRVNENQRHTGKGGLVFDKGSQLIERPTVQLASLRLPNPYPTAYPAQVFQSEAAAGVFGLVHKLFGDAMVHVGCEASLPTRQGFETTSGRMCVFGLEPRPYPVVPSAQTSDVGAGVEFAVAIHGNVDDAEIDTEMSFHVNRFGSLHVAGGEQVELAAHIAQVGLAAPGLEQFQITRPGDEGNCHTTVECPDRDSMPGKIPGQDAVVIGERAPFEKAALGVLAYVVGVGDTANGANGHLSRQAEPFANIVVGQIVERKLAKGLRLPRLVGDVIARFIGAFQRHTQGINLFDGGEQLDPRR